MTESVEEFIEADVERVQEFFVKIMDYMKEVGIPTAAFPIGDGRTMLLCWAEMADVSTDFLAPKVLN